MLNVINDENYYDRWEICVWDSIYLITIHESWYHAVFGYRFEITHRMEEVLW